MLISRSVFEGRAQALIVSPVVGASFWITGFYVLSYLSFLRQGVIVLSAVSAVIMDRMDAKKNKKAGHSPLPRWVFALCGCMVFSTLYFYEWNASLIPPFDDAKFHSFLVTAIEDHYKHK